MRGKGKPTLFSATREGNVADLEVIFEDPEINPNLLDNLGVPFTIFFLIFFRFFFLFYYLKFSLKILTGVLFIMPH